MEICYLEWIWASPLRIRIKQCRTALYTVQSNGAVERFSRFLTDGIRAAKADNLICGDGYSHNLSEFPLNNRENAWTTHGCRSTVYAPRHSRTGSLRAACLSTSTSQLQARSALDATSSINVNYTTGLSRISIDECTTLTKEDRRTFKRMSNVQAFDRVRDLLLPYRWNEMYSEHCNWYAIFIFVTIISICNKLECWEDEFGQFAHTLQIMTYCSKFRYPHRTCSTRFSSETRRICSRRRAYFRRRCGITPQRPPTTEPLAASCIIVRKIIFLSDEESHFPHQERLLYFGIKL